MKSWLNGLELHADRLARACALCGMLGLVALTVLTNFDVFMRSIFNSPIDGIADIAPLLVTAVVASCFPFALAGRHHISLNFFGALLRPRARAWLDALVALVTLVFFVLLTWQFALYTIDLHDIGQTTWAIRMPVAPWWMVVSAFIAVCVVVQFIVFLTDLGRALRWQSTDDASPGRGGS